MNYKIEKLMKGESFITSERGNSMTPLIYSGQKHELSPITIEDCKVWRYYLFVELKGNFIYSFSKSYWRSWIIN